MPADLTEIPTPYRDERCFPGPVHPHAKALWDWYDVAGSARMEDDAGAMPGGAERGGTSGPVEEIRERAVAACREAGQPESLLSSRLRAARRVHSGEGLSIADGADLNAFAADWCGDHARLLAGLAGLTGSWQLQMAAELARGFFLTGTVVRAPDQLSRGLVFFPSTDRVRFAITGQILREPEPGSGMRRLLWKQAVRARDALARGRPLIDEMPFLLAHRSRRYWFAALELLVQAEKRQWDVWNHPPRITPLLLARTRLMALAGRTAFRRR